MGMVGIVVIRVEECYVFTPIYFFYFFLLSVM